MFTEELSTECLTKYGNVGKLINLGKYYEAVQRSRADFKTGDADDDKLLYLEALKGWAESTAVMKDKQKILYRLIWGYLSP